MWNCWIIPATNQPGQVFCESTRKTRRMNNVELTSLKCDFAWLRSPHLRLISMPIIIPYYLHSFSNCWPSHTVKFTQLRRFSSTFSDHWHLRKVFWYQNIMPKYGVGLKHYTVTILSTNWSQSKFLTAI